MDDLTRRDALQRTAGLGLIAALATPHAQAADQDNQEAPAVPTTDRGRVLAVGMTEAEADCWEATARAAGLFFELPELHPTDKEEVAAAIHVVQYKLLSRPTYRRYLELARAADEQAP